jgi:RNA polymerase sigma-70 factor, ECF subfamily
MDAIRERRSEALALLYDETSSIVFGLASRILNNPADAEEVLLDTYLQVWSAAATYDSSRGTVLAWLTTMIRNRAIDRLRQAAARRSRELPWDGAQDFPSGLPMAEHVIACTQQRDLVRGAVALLAPEQRQAIELAFFRGMTHVQVAEALGTPLGTVKSRIRIGIQNLRHSLPSRAS